MSTTSAGGDLRHQLRAADEREECLLIPGVFDVMSGLLAAAAGFEAIYVGSYATAFHGQGLPDTGYIGRSDMLDNVRRLTARLDLPVLADAEAGFGNAVHVRQTVRSYERAGAAGLHIEDHEFGKHLTGFPTISPTGVAVDRLRAALDARTDAAFLIIARTDCKLSKQYGVDEVIARLSAYAEAGADMIFAPGLQPDEIAVVHAATGAPLVSDPVALSGRSPSLHESWEAGVRVSLYGTVSTSLAFAAVRAGLRELRDNGATQQLREAMVGMKDLDEFLGVAELRADAARYHALDASQLESTFW